MLAAVEPANVVSGRGGHTSRARETLSSGGESPTGGLFRSGVSVYAPHHTQVLNEARVSPDLKPYLLTRVNQGARASAEKLRADFESATTPQEYKTRSPPKDFKLDLVEPLRTHAISLLDEVGWSLGSLAVG